MKLTDKQLSALQEMYNEGGIRSDERIFHTNTLNSLVKHKLAKWVLYSDCSMYEITDKGIETLPRIN